jgi:transcriptional regulator with XRE-family HTH domain
MVPANDGRPEGARFQVPLQARGRGTVGPSDHLTILKGNTVAKSPSPTDKHVGARVRMRRLMLGLSQEKLADGLGLTFQQVQKYEKGTNRIGASRLQQIANILKVPPQFFFEELPKSRGSGNYDSAPSTDFINEFVASNEGLALIKAFMAIENNALRRSIVHVVEQISEEKA